jgi:hypothetical protein
MTVNMGAEMNKGCDPTLVSLERWTQLEIGT